MCAMKGKRGETVMAELAKLGHSVDKDTVAKYMPEATRPPRRTSSQTWKTFLRNHLSATIAIDFLTVPTVTFNIVYVFFCPLARTPPRAARRVTAHPYAAWAAQQIVEALGADFAPAMAAEPPSAGKLVALSRVGALHHRYARVA
jgi:hypothetical protein